MENEVNEPFRVVADNFRVDVSWETLDAAQDHADNVIDKLRKDLEVSKWWPHFRHQPDLDKMVALKKRQLRETDEFGQSQIAFFGTIVEIINCSK